MAPLVTFIVPVYNTRKYLRSCLSSLLDQGLEDGLFEIVFINDGSSDGSDILCAEFANRYSFIRIISQNNMGLSAARNSGIRAALGEYLCFIDPDDQLRTGGIASLLQYCNGKNDLIRFWYELVYPKAKHTVGLGDGRVTFAGSGHDYLCQFGLETFCCNYLYRRQFLEKSRLFFVEGLIGEDFPFMFDVLMTNPSIISVARRIYQYNINPNSISTTRTPDHSRRWVQDLLGSMSRIARILDSFKVSDIALYRSCRFSLEKKTLSLFSRSLSARYTKGEFRQVLSSCKSAGLLPFQFQSNIVISLLARFPFLYPIASFLFRQIFLPFIYPTINKTHD